jgi:hypothetical protein
MQIFIIFLVLSFSARAQEPLNEHLQPLLPFIGKTWKGTFKESTLEKPMYDISQWERILNGQGIRILHSVNDGEYGGETIIYWDAAKSSLVFFYFTTAGFYTTGTMTMEGHKLVGSEQVTGNQNGITEVRSTGEILPDGRMHSKAEYFQNGKWIPGHEIFYVPDTTSVVIFK